MKALKLLLLIGTVLFSSPALAKDMFIANFNPIWKIEYNIGSLKIKSIYPLTIYQKRLLENTYVLTKIKFLEFFNSNELSCNDNEAIEIRIVDENILDNRVNFPQEDTYSSLGIIVFGRYFRSANILYIVPPNLKKYYWKSNFAHELMHHFYDNCGTIFSNNNTEHVEIERFLKLNKELF